MARVTNLLILLLYFGIQAAFAPCYPGYSFWATT
jgi:hypothetical protein